MTHRIQGGKHSLWDPSKSDFRSSGIPDDLLSTIRSKFPNNYFGLPPYSLQQSPSGLTYQCRKPIESDILDDEGSLQSTITPGTERVDTANKRNQGATVDAKATNYIAQRKVAAALLTMVSNQLMLQHFLFKGGFEAVLKLINDTDDHEVLTSCSDCLIQVAQKEEHCKYLVDKGIFQAIGNLLEKDDSIRNKDSMILAKLSYVPGLEDYLLLNNVVQILQSLLNHGHRSDTICFSLLSLCNVASAIIGADAEVVVRLSFQATKKVDIARSYQKALFIADVFNNFSRMNQYTSLLVDEGLLPLLLHLMDSYSYQDDILKRTCEALANLSINRKNRREIASSGIASKLTLLFERGSASTRSSTLLLMGNLLSSGLFFDKVANPTTISNILDNLLDIQYPKQFNAVSYVLCQLSKNELSCEVLLECSIVPIVLGYMRKAPKDSLDYLWTVLVNLTNFQHYFHYVLPNICDIIYELYQEIQYLGSSLHVLMCITKIAYNLSRLENLPLYFAPNEKTAINPNTYEENIELFTKICKMLLVCNRFSCLQAANHPNPLSPTTPVPPTPGHHNNKDNHGFASPSSKHPPTTPSNPSSATATANALLIAAAAAAANAANVIDYEEVTVQLQLTSLISLINYAYYCQPARTLILSNNLLELFYEVGYDNDLLTVRYIGLVNILSNEESCCYRLLEFGIQKFLVALQESFQRLTNESSSTGGKGGDLKQEAILAKKKTLKSLKSSATLNASTRSMETIASSSNGSRPGSAHGGNSPSGGGQQQDGELTEYDPRAQGELGKSLTAATLHNLALKRAILGPGVLTMMLTLSKNTKTLRVLHCIRAMANMSVHSKSKLLLAKEARKIIPMLTVIMRSGCDEAEFVQYYCSIILCNLLALTTLDKTILLDLIKTNAIVDMMVVTLLRINAIKTKEILTKAFFNLLSRSEIREQLILQLDILSMVLELAKVEHIELLELCIRVLYNVTCELKKFIPGTSSGGEKVAASGSGGKAAKVIGNASAAAPTGLIQNPNYETYGNKFSSLKIISTMVSRLVYSPNLPGSMSNRPIRLLLGMSLANISFHATLITEMTLLEGKIADALYRVYVLHTDESIFCAAVAMYNMSRISECKVLAGSKAVQLVVEILEGRTPESAANATANPNASSTQQLNSTAAQLTSAPMSSTAAVNKKLCIASLCNFSAYPVFHEQLSTIAVSSIVNVISSPQLHMSMKIDAIQTIYNLCNSYPHARRLFIEQDVAAGLWKLLKASVGGGHSFQNHDQTTIQDIGKKQQLTGGTIGGSNQSVASNSVADNGGEEGMDDPSATTADQTNPDDDEVYLLLLTGHILKDITEQVSEDVTLVRKLLSDGVMNILLKLAKLELVDLKIDISFVLYALTRCSNNQHENMKLLKRDAIDIIFWLTMYDTLTASDLILQNIARTIRGFSIGAEECKILIKQERFFSVMKTLVKSTKEDILWQTAGIFYNMMQIESCLKKLMDNGLIQYIFIMARNDFESVKHVCSACLHMVPEAMPNIEDPLALELVLCLLHATGDKFSEISIRPTDVLPYILGTSHRASRIEYPGTNFISAWPPFTCIVENTFTPAIIYQSEPCMIQGNLQPSDPASIINTERHKKLTEKDYEFQRDLTSSDSHATANSQYADHYEMETEVKIPPVIEREPSFKSKAEEQSHHRKQSMLNIVDDAKHILAPAGIAKTTSTDGALNGSTKSSTFSLTDTTLIKPKSSGKLPLVAAPAPVPENTMEALQRSQNGSSSSKSLRILPSSVSFKPATMNK